MRRWRPYLGLKLPCDSLAFGDGTGLLLLLLDILDGLTL